MKLHQAQGEIAKDNHRFRVVNCGRRFGKTTLAVEEIKGKALYRQSRIAYIAPTYQQARDIAWQTLIKELDPIIINKNESRLELTVSTLDGRKSVIVLRGWESIETLRGQQFDFLVIDEVASMRSFWLYWQEVVRPTLTDTRGSAMFISTPKGFNHFYDLYTKEGEDSDYKSFHFSTFDNPHIHKEEVEKARQELTEDRFAQEYLADFRKTEGLVYKEFNRGRDLIDDKTILPAFDKNIIGLDWGYTNPACILDIKIDGDLNYWVMNEWYRTNRSTDQIIQVAQSFQPHEVYPDPAEPDRLAELENAGMNVREVSKDIVAGVNKVRELFKSGRIKIHKGCKNLIWELETYHYPEKKFDRNDEEKPVKENDHAMDALRYALYMTANIKKTQTFDYEYQITDY